MLCSIARARWHCDGTPDGTRENGAKGYDGETDAMSRVSCRRVPSGRITLCATALRCRRRPRAALTRSRSLFSLLMELRSTISLYLYRIGDYGSGRRVSKCHQVFHQRCRHCSITGPDGTRPGPGTPACPDGSRSVVRVGAGRYGGRRRIRVPFTARRRSFRMAAGLGAGRSIAGGRLLGKGGGKVRRRPRGRPGGSRR